MLNLLVLLAPLLIAAADAPPDATFGALHRALAGVPVHVDHPWARASAGAAKNGAAFFTITGNGPADRVTGVSTPVAEMAELHETIDDRGVMKMRPVAGLALESGKPVTLVPGGKHVMLMGLKAPLKLGDRFPLTLMFEHAAPVTVTVTVEAAGTAR